MIVARMILVSAMLTVGIVETTRTVVPRLAEEAPATLSGRAPVDPAPVVPVPSAPAAGPVCAGATWPYLPESCLQPASPAEPRRPVRVIERQRSPAPARIPGRVSVG
ncbi:hypothetical protein FF100_17475 [Methylobacterium terricola]|uniref:Uncharacterized protein n=1 Tax=Methylobacterium terricola TaxID=2583531 RepID=A0A5C4LFY6_9HYPH|nr:hypothetical protein [Methylobacterium terricola]TNC12031.1 hypothetical protein FF100_17475 [Methylobacterium terricola]